MTKVAYFPCQQDPPRGERMGELWQEIVAEVKLAEEVGFDLCVLGEHHQQPDGFLPSPLTALGLLGAQTTRIRIGTSVLLLPLRHPVRVAEDAALVDIATGGRLTLGVGIGYQPIDFAPFGVPVSERVGRLEEGVEVLRRCWSDERFSVAGRHFRLRDLSVTPKPLQKPGPPIWMAAWTQAGIERAARLADGWIADPIQSLPVIRRFAATYREAAHGHGKQPFIALRRDVLVGDGPAEVEAESGAIMVTHRFYFRNGGYVRDPLIEGVRSEADWTFERAARDRFIVGAADDCLAELTRWRDEIRPDVFVLRMRHPGGSGHDRAQRAIRAFGERVLPNL